MPSTTKVKFDIIDLFGFKDRSLNEQFKSKLGRAIVDETKALIASGVSPVRSFGRFIGYSQSYLNQIRSNQRRFAEKTTRPVNLNLSGKMLSYYTFQSLTGMSIKVGIIGAPTDVQAYADAHQNGNPSGNLPTRRMVPESAGEEFAVSIQRQIKEVYSDWVSAIVQKSNR